MKIRDAIACALKNLGRNELAESVSAGVEADGEEADTVNTLLYCFNAVEDEIARRYIPLHAEETINSANGRFLFASFDKTPVRIKRVTSDGKDIEYQIFPSYLQANAKTITVEFEYSPAKKTISDYSDYWSGEAGEYMFACGMTAEYCLLNGEIEAAEVWESKYRQSIDEAQRHALPSGGHIPPRRWV